MIDVKIILKRERITKKKLLRRAKYLPLKYNYKQEYGKYCSQSYCKQPNHILKTKSGAYLCKVHLVYKELTEVDYMLGLEASN